MCGRFSIHLIDLDVLREPLALQHIHVGDWAPRYNVAPTQAAPVIVQDPERSLVLLRWGLSSRRGRDRPDARLLINARIETARERPSFREALRTHRCVVPVTGFYEWKVLPGRRSKQPMWIRPRDRGVLPVAGLWAPGERSGEAAGGTFAIVTRDAAGLVRDIHDRMPVELRGEWLDAWLDPTARAAELVERLSAPDADVSHLEAIPVSTAVNAPAHDAPDCIEPLSAPTSDGQLDFFAR